MGGAFRRWPRGAPARGFRGGGASLPPRPRALAGAGRRPPRARRGAARLRVRAGGAHAARPSGVAAATGSGLPRRRGLRAPARRRPGDRARAPTPRERDRRGRPSDPRVPRGARARRGRRPEGELRAGRKRVVVIGGGFAGLHLIRRLEHSLRGNAVELTLVDRQNYHLFTPLLYQVATGELPPHAVAYPLRDATAPARYRFVQSEVEEIDLERRVVRTSEGELAYDHVVIAPGSVTNDYGIPGVREHALSVKTLADGEALKRHVLDRFEAADSETDPGRRREELTFVIVGAGPVGVELASSLRDLMDHTLRRIYPSIDFYRDITIHLLDGAARVIPGMDARLSRIAMKRLQQQRVNVLLRTLVSEIGEGCVRTKDGAELRGRTIIWSGGVKMNPLVASLDLPKAKDGRLIVDATFRVGGRDDVLALGDAAYFEYPARPR